MITALRGLMLVLVLGSCAAAEELTVGDEVFWKLEAKPTADGKAVPLAHVHFPSIVKKIEGDRVWVGSAWLRRSDALTADEAIAYYSERIRADKKNAELCWRRAIIWKKQQRYDSALEDAEKAVKLDPKSAAALAVRGEVRGNHGDEKGAMADFTEAIRLDPKCARAYADRGNGWSRRQEHRKAADDLSEAIRLDPAPEASCYVLRGQAWLGLGELDKGLADCTETIRLDEGAALLGYLLRAQIYLSRKDYAKAIADIDAAIRLDPMKPEIYWMRGVAHHNAGDYDAAIKDLDEMLRLSPDQPTALLMRAAVWQKSGDAKKALADFEDAIRADPTSVDAHCLAAILLAAWPDDAVRNGAKALKHARKACELSDWKRIEALEALAAASAETGDFKAAVEWQEKALALPVEEGDDETAGRQARLALFKAGKPFRMEK